MKPCVESSCNRYDLRYSSSCNHDNSMLTKACFNYASVKDIDESPLDSQIGGDHYKSMKIQPIEFTHKNNLNFCQGNVIKYITRYKNKNGKEDLEKVKHYVDLLIELEYGEE